MDLNTLPAYLYNNFKKSPDKTAFREKDLGIWQSFTWSDYLKNVCVLAAFFEDQGLKKGDTIAVVGDNKPEWVVCEMAAQLLGVIPIGIYQDSVISEVKYILGRAEVKVVVAEDQEQVDKILDILEESEGDNDIKCVIYYDDKGMYQYDDPALVYYGEIFKNNYFKNDGFEQYCESKISNIDENDVAVMCTTSGTTGFPKLAMLTHKNMIFMSRSLGKADPKYENDEFVSFLPLPWIGEQMMCIASALIFGFKVNFPESHDTVQNDMKEIGPNLIFSPPRVWENLASNVQVKIMDTSRFKRFVYNKCLPVGYKFAECRFDKVSPSFLLKIKYRLAYLAVFKKLKERMGFSFLRSAITGGAALGPDTFKFFHALGINLKQIYGQTEISGISCIHRQDDVDFTSVGKPIEGTEIKILEDGEIISKSDAVFAGYYKDQKATDETLKEGWLYSGDAGYFDENGKLVVLDRKKDIMHLNDGTMFSPQFLENKIKFSPYVKEAVALGNNRDFIAMIINIDMDIVSKWAEENKLSYTTYTDLSSKNEVYELIAKEVAGVNSQLKENMKIRRFVLLYKELDADDGELTRTRKVRRGFVEERYKEIVEALYGDKDDITIDAVIRLQDEREKRIHTTMKIYNMVK